jgi:hypothetical protein
LVGITAHFQKVKGRLLWAVLGSLALFSPVRAATNVSGPIVTDEVWTLAQSPYTVTGDVLVQNGAILTIEPGVVVRMDTDKNLLIEAGALSARGNAQSPIVFTSFKDDGVLAPAAGDWGQLRFLDGTDDAATIIEHVHVRYGYGIAIESASPTINYADITNNAAAAIAMDLRSSPAGVGNTASGNTLNGISVPAGNIADSVAWKLKGLPYVVSQGTVSVGQAPMIATLTPSEIQQGETLEMTLTGSRLQDVERITFDDPNVTAVVLSQTEATAKLTATAAASAAIGLTGVEAQVAAGIGRLDGALKVIAPRPAIVITGIEPDSIRSGETKTFQVSGSNFEGVKITTSDPTLVVNQVVVAADGASLSLSLTALAGLPVGTQTLTFTNNSVSGAAASVDLIVVEPPPSLFALPAPMGVPPDATARQYALKLSAPDSVDHTIALSIANTTMVTVSPSSIVIGAGQTEAAFELRGLKVGETALSVTSTTLGTLSMPVYVSTEFAGARAAYSKILGLVLEDDAPVTQAATSVSPVLGVVVGEDQTAQPQTIGLVTQLGVILEEVAAPTTFDVNSLTGTTLGVLFEDSVTTVPASIDVLAGVPLGVILQEDATPTASDVMSIAPTLGVALPPVATSIEPSSMNAGASGTLVVRGIGLAPVTAIKVVPSDGITLGAFEVSADGSTLSVPVTISSTAPATVRDVVLEMSSGQIQFADPAADRFSVVGP